MIKKYSKDEVIRLINNFQVSKNVNYFIKKYDNIIGHRDLFQWKFFGTVFKEIGVTLSSIDSGYLDSITDVKIIFSMICCIIDDTNEIYNDKELLYEMIKVLSNDTNDSKSEKNKRVLFVKELWEYIVDELSKYPRFQDLKDIFFFDTKQFLNAFEYSNIVNTNPFLLNLNELDDYDCHNMMVFLFNGIDLMVSSDINKNELPFLRTAFWHAQKMARIGNWLSTWKREVHEKDTSSGVFAYAVSKGIIDINELHENNENEIIEKIKSSDYKKHFSEIWKQNYKILYSLKKKIKSVDMDTYITGLENLIEFHLLTEGLR